MSVTSEIPFLYVDPKPLGKILQDFTLWVDTNQRNYAWTKVQVEDLYNDFKDTIKTGGGAFPWLNCFK